MARRMSSSLTSKASGRGKMQPRPRKRTWRSSSHQTRGAGPSFCLSSARPKIFLSNGRASSFALSCPKSTRARSFGLSRGLNRGERLIDRKSAFLPSARSGRCLSYAFFPRLRCLAAKLTIVFCFTAKAPSALRLVSDPKTIEKNLDNTNVFGLELAPYRGYRDKGQILPVQLLNDQ